MLDPLVLGSLAMGAATDPPRAQADSEEDQLAWAAVIRQAIAVQNGGG